MTTKKIISKIFSLGELVVDPPVLIDIGASGQLHKKWVLIAKYSICVAFDADNREFGFIEKEQSSFKKLFVFNSIVSDEDKSESEFYLTKSPFCSSVLHPDIKNLSNYSYSDLFQVVDKTYLKTISLSSVIKQLNIRQIDWFKSDSQGLDLRLFKCLPDEVRKKVIAAEFEPGLIDAYINEDKLFSILQYFEKKNFWISEFIVKGAPRVSAKKFKSIYSNEKLRKLLALSMKSSPGWAEISLLNTFAETDIMSKREYLLGCVFGIIEHQYGFVFSLSESGFEKFGDPIFNEISSFSKKKIKQELLKLKFVPSVIKRIKEITLNKLS